jgi:hypothetical protein
MKVLKFALLVVLFVTASSCSSINVVADYDTSTDFSQYKTFAFYKKGIEKVDISDIDKRRILKDIETELLAKGLTISEDPDLLVNIFTKSRRKVDIYSNNYGGFYGGGYYGWYPWYYGPNFGTTVSEYTEGTLFVDLIDAKKKDLVWQGIGSGGLTTNGDVVKKEQRIQEFVNQMMAQYPPAPIQTETKTKSKTK